jgi:hypothetical protein
MKIGVTYGGTIGLPNYENVKVAFSVEEDIEVTSKDTARLLLDVWTEILREKFDVLKEELTSRHN